MRPGINKRKSGDEASFHRLQVCLEPLLLQIKFPFYLTQHFIVDAPPVAQSDNGSSLGCEHLLAKTELGRKAITVLVVCGSRFVQTPRVVLDFLLIDGTQVGQILFRDPLFHCQFVKT